MLWLVASVAGDPERRRREVDQAVQEYWRKNIRLKMTLLAIWFVVSVVLSIFLAKPLNGASIGGFPLGFWMAQQGSIFTFVILIFVFAKTMDRYDSELEAKITGGKS